MALIVSSTKVTETPGGFNLQSILFCCCTKEAVDDNSTVQCALIPEKATNTGVINAIDEQVESIEMSTEEPEDEDVLEDLVVVRPPQTEMEQVFCREDDLDNISEYDVNMVTAKEHEIVEKTKTAELRFSFGYDAEKSTVTITIVDSSDLARPSSSTNSIRERVRVDVPAVLAYSVHILILPARKMRFKTKMRQGPDPYFNEIIKIPKVKPDEIKKWSLRFRLYGSMRNAMKGIIGEGFAILDSVSLDTRMEYRISLMNHNPNVPENVISTIMSTSKCDRGSILSLDSIDRMTSLIEGEAGPEVLIGLSYSSNTGRLTMEIIKGNKFPRLKDSKQPDTFIGITVTSKKGEEIANSKTTIKKGSCEPTFEEKFLFQILVFQLEEMTLTVTGYHKRSIGKPAMFGSFSMGNKNSSEEEAHHWKDIISSKCSDQIVRWHKFHSHTQDKT